MSTVIRSSATTPAELDQWFGTIDARRQADNPGGDSAREATLDAGQAAVDIINAGRGKP
jgi:hypothetical protein